MRHPWGHLAPAVVLLTLAGTGATTAQAPADQLHGWLRSGNVTALANAIDKDPGVVTRPDAEGVQPLAWAAFYGQGGVFDLLLARGADPRAPNPVIGTVLHAAVFGGRPEIIRTLAARGVDLNAGGEARLPPLVLAARRGLAPAAAALLDAGASGDARDAGGNSALLLAASYGHAAVVRALLAHNVDAGSANDFGITPIEAGLREGHTAVVELLRSAGAKAPAAMPAGTGAYLGQPPPDETRRVFAPRVVSTERRELNAAFTPDGRTLFFSRSGTGPTTSILMATSAGGAWRTPRPAPFGRTDASDVDMFVTADGAEIYFCSDRPRPDDPAPASTAKESPRPDSDIWVARSQGTGSGPATWLGPEVNARGADDYYPTLTTSGTLYFSSNRPGGLGQNDVYRSRRVNGRWTTPENLGAPVNTPGREFDPFIAPDESYLVFASERPGGLGASDLYVSARNKDGSWAPPVNLGPRVNSAFSDYTPMVSPDGRYLFLTSGALGSDDLYWVASSVIHTALGSRAEGHKASGSVPLLNRGTRPAAEIDEAVRAALQQTGVTAASIALVRTTGPIYTRALGARIGSSAGPADDRTVFRAASLGKAVFAYLVFTLVSEGRLDLDKPLHEYLPKPLPAYPDYAGLASDPRYRTITARLALSHRTGFPNWRWQMKDRKLALLFNPGEKFLYSGEGYRYLQSVVEQVTGTDLETLARERVFRPLGMTDSSYAWREGYAENCAIDRAPIEKVFGPEFLKVPNCAGSLLTTATDYGRFLGAVLAGTGLPGPWRNEMLEPQVAVAGKRLFGPAVAAGPATGSASSLFWCLGWSGFRSNAGAVRFHVGYDSPEYENYAVLYLDKGLGLVILTSGGRGPRSAVPVFVEAVLGPNDTPFAWAGYE